MDLILWRHADAGNSGEGPEDIARPLSAKGEQQAERMAAWIDQHLPDTAKIIASPAARAQQTAEALKRKFKTDARLAPGASLIEVIAASGFPEGKNAVLLVGHQPALGLLATNFLFPFDTDDARSHSMSIAKGAVLWLTHRCKNGIEEVVLRALLSPAFV